MENLDSMFTPAELADFAARKQREADLAAALTSYGYTATLKNWLRTNDAGNAATLKNMEAK